MVVGHKNMDGIDRIRVGEKVAWFPTTPNNNAGVQDHFTSGDDNTAYASSNRYDAQTFTVAGTDYYTISVKLLLLRDAGYSATTAVSIYNVDENGAPDDSSVRTTSADVAASSITTAAAGAWVEFIFPSRVYLASGTKYAMVLKPSGANVYWRYDSGNGYANGSLYLRNVGTWSISTGNDALFEVYVASGSAPNHTITVDNPGLFGGNEKEGGVRGNIDLLFGASDQAQNTYLASKLDANIPAFRGSMGLVLNQVYVGTSPYIKSWAFLCRRVFTQVNGDAQWNITKAAISGGAEDGDDLNPAHIIRECLINTGWGIGFETSDIDSTSFERAADILYDEVFGLSLLWDQIEPIEDFVGSVLRTIAGFLYQDLATGKWVLSLTRDPNLPIIDESTAYAGLIPSGNPTLISFQAGVDPEEQQRGETFTPLSTFNTSSVALKLGSDDTVSVKIEIQSTTAGLPNGSVLAFGSVEGSDMLSVDDLLADDLGWITANLDREVTLVSGTQYAIVFYITTPGVATVINYESSIYGASLGPPYGYTGGTRVDSNNFGASWAIPSSGRIDLFFRILGVVPESFNENHIMDVEEFARPSYGEVIDQVIVNWWDKLADKSRIAMAQDIALIEKQNNNIIEQNLNHFGICNATLANKVAERELKLASSMLAAMRLKCTRRMSHLKPNDIFKLSWSELGIVQMVVRVVDVNYGSLQNNEVVMTCIEDAFSTAATVYADPPDSEWTDPVNDALDISNIDIIEIPYWILINEIENQSVVDAYSTAAGFLMLVTAPPTDDSLDFEYLLQQSAGLAFVSEGTAAFTPNATLTSGIFKEAQSVTVDLATTYSLTLVEDSLVAGETYAIINTEIVKVTSVDITNSQVTIERGVLDTVPEAHSAGDFVYFLGADYENIETEYTDSDQPAFKILSRTGNGKLIESSASTQTADLLDSRAIRPYPPGNLKFNTESFPTFLSTAITGGFEITWSHRDRTDATQVGTIVLHTDATDYGPEAGTTYTIKIYDEDDVLARTVTGIAGTAYEYTEAFEIADSGALQKQLRFEIYSVRDGFDSWLLGYNVLIKRTLAGLVSASSGASGTLSVETSLVGSASATSAASVPGLDIQVMLGVVSASSTTTGYLTGGKTLIRGTVAASSAATGELTIT